MRVLTLDSKKTHESNPDCPSRLMPNPVGGWYCLDCGAQILCTTVEVTPNEYPLYNIKTRPDQPQLDPERLQEFVRMVEGEANFGAPVDAFDRMSCCYAGSAGLGTTNSSAELNQNYFTASMPALAVQMGSCDDFIKKTEEGWKAIEQGRVTTLEELKKKLGDAAKGVAGPLHMRKRVQWP